MEEDAQLASTKPFTIVLPSTESIELNWREGVESYDIGLRFIRMGRAMMREWKVLFTLSKKGEDKEGFKQASLEAVVGFIENECHLI